MRPLLYARNPEQRPEQSGDFARPGCDGSIPSTLAAWQADGKDTFGAERRVRCSSQGSGKLDKPGKSSRIIR